MEIQSFITLKNTKKRRKFPFLRKFYNIEILQKYGENFRKTEIQEYGVLYYNIDAGL